MTSDDLDAAPIQRCLAVWHEFLGGDRSALDRVIAADAVLHSPVLFTPQRGKDLVTFYLSGASMSFSGDTAAGTLALPATPEWGAWDGRFRYVRQVIGARDAVLEFETTIDGKYVNGVDMITCDDDGQIVDFKVMIRPLQALEAVRRKMFAALEQIKAGQ